MHRRDPNKFLALGQILRPHLGKRGKRCREEKILARLLVEMPLHRVLLSQVTCGHIQIRVTAAPRNAFLQAKGLVQLWKPFLKLEVINLILTVALHRKGKLNFLLCVEIVAQILEWKFQLSNLTLFCAFRESL